MFSNLYSSPDNLIIQDLQNKLLEVQKEIDKFSQKKVNSKLSDKKKLNNNFNLNNLKEYYLDFGTSLAIENFSGKSLELFNNNNYEDYVFTQNTLDLFVNIKKPFGDIKHEFFADIRAKGVFGATGKFNSFEPKPIKIGIGHTETSIAFRPKLQNLWIRELWLNYNISEKFKTNLKLGFFPHAIGSGLSLGNAHKVGKLIPGYYTEKFVDQFRPGIKLSGEIAKNLFGYSLYSGVILNKGASFDDTAQFSRAQEVRYKSNPYRDQFSGNTLGSIELDFHAKNNKFDLNLKPYLILNYDNNQQVEFPNDATSFLGIAGFSANLESSNISIFGEAAMNFGRQYVKEWDRDAVLFNSTPEHTHLFQDFDDTGNPLYRQAKRTPYPENLSFDKPPGIRFLDQLDDATAYKNSFSRFRKPYTNYYQGHMLYGEVAYHQKHPKLPDTHTTIALALGYASGDDNPNDTFEKVMANRLKGTCVNNLVCSTDISYLDYDKKYFGFQGVEQMHVNRNVNSVFMLESHKLNQPLSRPESKLTYPEFSNLGFIGAGVTYDKNISNKKFTFKSNVLTYWQPHKILKGYNYALDTLFAINSCGDIATTTLQPTLETDSKIKLDSHLGSEANLTVNCNLDDNLSAYLNCAMFIPGNYYTSAKDKVIPISEQYNLAQIDNSGYEIDSTKYNITLSDKKAFIINAGFNYNFDTSPKVKVNRFLAKEKPLKRVRVPLTISNTHQNIINNDLSYKEPKIIKHSIMPIETLGKIKIAKINIPEPVKLDYNTVSKLESLDYKEPATSISSKLRPYKSSRKLINIETLEPQKLNSSIVKQLNNLDYQEPSTININIAPARKPNLITPEEINANKYNIDLNVFNNLTPKPISHKSSPKLKSPRKAVITEDITRDLRDTKLSSSNISKLNNLDYKEPKATSHKLSSKNKLAIKHISLEPEKLVASAVHKLGYLDYNDPKVKSSRLTLPKKVYSRVTSPEPEKLSINDVSKLNNLDYSEPNITSYKLKSSSKPTLDSNQLNITSKLSRALTSTNELTINKQALGKHLEYNDPEIVSHKLSNLRSTLNLNIITKVDKLSPEIVIDLSSLDYQEPIKKTHTIEKSELKLTSPSVITHRDKLSPRIVVKLSHLDYKEPNSKEFVINSYKPELDLNNLAITNKLSSTISKSIKVKPDDIIELNYKDPELNKLKLVIPSKAKININLTPEKLSENVVKDLRKLDYQDININKVKLAKSKINKLDTNNLNISDKANRAISKSSKIKPEKIRELNYKEPKINNVKLAKSKINKLNIISTATPVIRTKVSKINNLTPEKLSPNIVKTLGELDYKDINISQPKLSRAKPRKLNTSNLAIPNKVHTAVNKSKVIAPSNIIELNYQNPKPKNIKLTSPAKTKININLNPEKLSSNIVINLSNLDYKEIKTNKVRLTKTKPNKLNIISTNAPTSKPKTIKLAPEKLSKDIVTDLGSLDYKDIKPSKSKLTKVKTSKLNINNLSIPNRVSKAVNKSNIVKPDNIIELNYQDPKPRNIKLILPDKADININLSSGLENKLFKTPKLNLSNLDYKEPEANKVKLTKSKLNKLNIISTEVPAIKSKITKTNKSQSIRLTPEKLSKDIIKDLGYLDYKDIKASNEKLAKVKTNKLNINDFSIPNKVHTAVSKSKVIKPDNIIELNYQAPKSRNIKLIIPAKADINIDLNYDLENKLFKTPKLNLSNLDYKEPKADKVKLAKSKLNKLNIISTDVPIIKNKISKISKSQAIKLTPDKLSKDIIKDLGELDYKDIKINKIKLAKSKTNKLNTKYLNINGKLSSKLNQDVRFINNIDLNNINSSKPSLYKLKSTKKPQITINLTPDKLEPTLVINLNDLDYKEPKVINKKLTNKKPSLDKKYLLETINLNNRSNTIRDASELDYKEPKYNRKKINKSNLRYNPSINISIITPDIIISNKTNNLEKLDYSVPNIKSKNIKSRLKTKKINKKITIPKVETIDTLKDLNLDTRIPELKICINKDKFKLCKPEIACDFIDPGENIKITEPEDFDKDLLEINLDLRYLNNKDHSLNIKIEDTDLEIPEIDLSKVLKNLKAKKYSTGLNSNEEDLLNKYKNQLYKL